MTTTPSRSARIKSPGLIVRGVCWVGDVNCTGTLSAADLVKVFEPSDEVPLAKSFDSQRVEHKERAKAF